MAVDDVSRDAGIRVPFAACEPDGTFVFVSYAHADKAVVYPELKRASACGVRIWFDEGITPSSEWPEEVARAIDQASLFHGHDYSCGSGVP